MGLVLITRINIPPLVVAGFILNFGIAAIDGRIEKQLDKLVKMLADTTDSQDSKRQVSQLMLGAIQGLSRSIELYAYKRKEMSERIKKGDEAALVDLGQLLDGAC